MKEFMKRIGGGLVGIMLLPVLLWPFSLGMLFMAYANGDFDAYFTISRQQGATIVLVLMLGSPVVFTIYQHVRAVGK